MNRLGQENLFYHEVVPKSREPLHHAAVDMTEYASRVRVYLLSSARFHKNAASADWALVGVLSVFTHLLTMKVFK